MMLKAIPDFAGYSIDADGGLVFSHKSNKFLQMRPNNHGYGRTEVYNKGERKHIFNHIKVVAIHGDSEGNHLPDDCYDLRSLGLSIDHLNRDKMDPSKANLELVAHKENCRRRDLPVKDLPADFPIPNL